jgi:hypothetical protein
MAEQRLSPEMTGPRRRIFTTGIVTLTAAWGGVALLASNADAFAQSSTATTTTATTPGTTTTTPGSTSPGSVDTASDLAALTAYRSYLQSLVTGATAARAQEQVFVTTTASTCEGALTPITSMAKSDVSGDALTALGQEIGSDLWLSFSSVAADPFTQLSQTLASLAWTHDTTAQAVMAFLNAERAVLTMPASNLCKDALLLAAKPTAEPVTAKTFLFHYQTARATLKARLATFLSVLERFQTPTEAKLVSSIDRLAAQFDSLSLTAQQGSAGVLLSDLGI